MRDTLYQAANLKRPIPDDQNQVEIEPFRFDKKVVSVFEDMINRSVPGYASVIAMTGALAAKFAQDNSTVYDLGTSLGAGTFSIADQVKSDIKIIAVDNSQAMIDRLCERLAMRSQEIQNGPSIHCKLADISTMSFVPSRFIALNYTLQFMPLSQRQQLLQKLFDCLLPGGALLISEKIHFADEAHDELMKALHEDFKHRNGYSKTEIAGKRRALENVLVTEPLGTHVERLRALGFKSVDVWFQCFNFCSLLAIK